jgi:DNA-binding transcriptional ArsR family regulator
VDHSTDVVFKALADGGRRALLDALRERDGQTLGELCGVLPDMTRFGVMKHLKVLEEAHLVVSEKRGREKFHYLNPIPIREIHDRWISRYAEPFVVGLLALRDAAESQTA